MNLAQLHKVSAELGFTHGTVLQHGDAIELQLRAPCVQVLPEKPDNAAAALKGLALLAALPLSGGR